jgi:4-hydroxy-tetrahydrodipicolinate synthase
VKLAAGGIDADTIELMSSPPPGFAVLGGDDAFISPLLALGAQGAIAASAHVRTGAYASLVAHWHAGDMTTARDIGARLARLSLALFAEPNPSVIKGVLHAQGRIPSPAVRLPLLPASRDSVDAALRLLQTSDNRAYSRRP